MNFEDLKENLKNQWDALLARLNDNPTFQGLKDRFQSLPERTQKIVQVAGCVFLVLIAFSIPWSTYSVSSENVEAFESKKSLVRDLLKVHREAADSAPTFAILSASDVKMRVEQAVTAAGLIPEQIKGTTSLPSSGNLIKNSLVEAIIETQASQLNLTQIVNLSVALARIDGARMKDMLIDASSKDPRYFDVTFRLIAFKSFQSNIAMNDLGGDIPPPPAPGKGKKGDQ
jgi:hypothetical protein